MDVFTEQLVPVCWTNADSWVDVRQVMPSLRQVDVIVEILEVFFC